MVYETEYASPLGKILLDSDGERLIGLWFAGQKYFRHSIREPVKREEHLPVFEKTTDWLDRYFAGEKPEAGELPLAPFGSGFRQQVWKLLCQIPYGQVTTYGAVAAKLAALENRKTMSAQAVGGAIGHNPISIIIPCHRVVGADGSLTGYAGGIERKKQLLALEGIDPGRFDRQQGGVCIRAAPSEED